MRHWLGAAGLLAVALGGQVARAQTSVERFERQLQQIQRDQRLRINPDIPADQRALLDYGGYFTFNFFSIDDIEQKTHILRQYDLVAYGRLNIDNVHEFFLRARTSSSPTPPTVPYTLRTPLDITYPSILPPPLLLNPPTPH